MAFINDETRAEYWKDVKNIAAEIVQEHGDDEAAIAESVSEYVDGSQWVIYNGRALCVLLLTDNDPDGAEVGVMAREGDYWSMITAAAYLAMEADVHEEIERRRA